MFHFFVFVIILLLFCAVHPELGFKVIIIAMLVNWDL